VKQTLLVSLSNILPWTVVMPVACLSLSFYHIDPDVIPWLAVLALPVNSLLNPVVYTFTTKSFTNWLLKYKKNSDGK